MRVIVPGVLRDFWLENPDARELPAWLVEKLAGAVERGEGRNRRSEIELDSEQQREELDKLAHDHFMDEGGKGNNVVAKAAFAVYHQVHKYERKT